jgi:hypothetical protein
MTELEKIDRMIEILNELENKTIPELKFRITQLEIELAKLDNRNDHLIELIGRRRRPE